MILELQIKNLPNLSEDGNDVIIAIGVFLVYFRVN